VLPVQAVLDVLVHVYLVDDLVCIVLEGSCEDHDLVKFGHELYEIDTAWSHKEIAIASILN
jgi:hypothetical protein